MSGRTRSGAALLLAIGLALAACGDSTDSDAGAPVAGDGANGGGAAPVGEVDLDSSFTFAYSLTVSRLDPHQASISQDGVTLFPAYDRLVHQSPDGELIPGLAESWEFSDDLLTLTLQVRPDVTFHDGTVLDAEAVKLNLERVKSFSGSSAAGDLAAVSSVEVVDERTVRLALSEPNVALVGALSDRAGVMVSPTAIAGGVNLDAEMVGAGPFRMVSHVDGASTVFERYDGYWDEANRAKVARLEIRVLADAQTRLNAIRTDEVDATMLENSQLPDIENDPNLRIQQQTELSYSYIVQNRTRAGQGDLRVRQALLHALDRETICEALLFGRCELTDQMFPPGYFANDPSIDQVLYPYDPDRARELLEEAGVDGLELSVVIPAGLGTYQQMAEAIQAQWAEVGVEAELINNEPSQLAELMFVQEQYDAMVAGFGGRPDPSTALALRASSTAFANPGGHTTPTFEELLQQSLSIADPEERQEVLRAASREVAESVLEMVVLFPQTPYVSAANVDFEPYITGKPEFRSVAVHG